MFRKITLWVLMMTGNFYLSGQKTGIIPMPQQIEWLNDSVPLHMVQTNPPTTEKEREVIKKILPNTNQSANIYKIVFDVTDGLADEEYELTWKDKVLHVKYAKYDGLVYALQTVRQLISEKSGKSYLVKANIRDFPRFPYRGMHLDVGRHFYPVSFIFEYLDMMSRYKFNTFHWHLTEDQGWRIEIKKYPGLQTEAAWRDQTLIGHGSDLPKKFDGKKYGGYYTQEEVKQVVAYAAKLGIEVIPEIEMPGHAQAAIAAYPELGCTGNPVKVAQEWGVFEDVFCPTETTFQFLQDVLDEVMSLFPSGYIHIGGDECPKKQWKESAFCQTMIKDLGLKDEHELQSYFIQRIEKYVNAKGKKIIGWDEILEGGLAPNATVMSWRGIEGGLAAAAMGHDVIMTPTDFCYLDYYQSRSAGEPLSIGGFLPLEKVYSYEPVPHQLAGDKVHHILGTQGNVWTEYLNTEERVWYQVLPRALAIAETGWTQAQNKNLDDFLNRIDDHYAWWKKNNITAADKRFELMYQIEPQTEGSVGLKIRSKGGRYPVEIRQNGKEAVLNGNTVNITKSGNLQAAVTGTVNNRSLVLDFDCHLAFGAVASISCKPDPRYAGFGSVTLSDGLTGNNQSHHEGWLGFSEKMIGIQYNWEQPITVKEISIGFYHNPGQWIYRPNPKDILFEGSQPLTIIGTRGEKNENSNVLKFDIAPVSLKKLVITIQNENLIGSGLPGEGYTPWIFMDEVKIR